MEPILRSLILQGYRSFDQERVDFDNPTILVGQNGSGKSNLVDAITFLAEITSLPLRAVVGKRGGILDLLHQVEFGPRDDSSHWVARQHLGGRCGLAAVFGQLDGTIEAARYAFKGLVDVDREQCIVRRAETLIWFDRCGTRINTNATGINPGLDPDALGLPVVGGDTRFAPVLRALRSMQVYEIDPAKVGQLHASDSGTVLRRDGANAASVLAAIQRDHPEDHERIEEIIATIVPGLCGVRPLDSPRGLTIAFDQLSSDEGWLNFTASSMSRGTLRALGLILAVYQRPSPSVLVIEEPEATIHPGAIGTIMDLIHHASRSMQVIVTTHSPDLLDAKWIEARHLRVVIWEEGASRVRQVAEGAQRALQAHLAGAGELFRSNVLQPAPTADREIALFETTP